MQLQLQDFPTLVRNQVAAVTASCAKLMDVSVGSILRAVLEANASVALWLQWLIMEVLSLTRAATSNGVDLDSWVADFGLNRLSAVSATGLATFSRSTPGLAAIIPVGAIIRTGADANSQAFAVTEDSNRATWCAGGYALAAPLAEITVPIQALSPGQAGNVQAGVLVLLSTPIPGVDSVTNNNPMAGGVDAESDVALRSRFGGFMDSRTRATVQAVEFSIQSVQQDLIYKLVEQYDPSGTFRAGHFTVIIDDGSGSASDVLIGKVGAAIEAVRAIGSTYSVIPPLLVVVNVSLHISGGNPALVQSAIIGWLAEQPIGATIFISKLMQVAHDSDPNVLNVSDLSINGLASDLAMSQFTRPMPGVVSIST